MSVMHISDENLIDLNDEKRVLGAKYFQRENSKTT
jgi:hypothetical protein